VPQGADIMAEFRKYGILNKHDIGAVFDEGRYVGTALLCISQKHINVSVNINDFKFASLCLQYIYCINSENKKILMPMMQAIEIFKRSGSRNIEDAEFKVLEWYELERPSVVYELPFDQPKE
jgi:hypothetical protein